MTIPDGTSHGHFLLLLRVTGVDAPSIDARAVDINRAYMEQFGDDGAITMSLLELRSVVEGGTNAQQAPAWGYAIRYFGPVESVDWLQARLQSVATAAGGTVTTQTFIANDITGRY